MVAQGGFRSRLLSTVLAHRAGGRLRSNMRYASVEHLIGGQEQHIDAAVEHPLCKDKRLLHIDAAGAFWIACASG